MYLFLLPISSKEASRRSVLCVESVEVVEDSSGFSPSPSGARLLLNAAASGPILDAKPLLAPYPLNQGPSCFSLESPDHTTLGPRMKVPCECQHTSADLIRRAVQCTTFSGMDSSTCPSPSDGEQCSSSLRSYATAGSCSTTFARFVRSWRA